MIFVKNTVMVSTIVLILPRRSTFIVSVKLRNRKKKTKKMETTVKIEKKLSSLIKFDQFINLGNIYHVFRCQKEKCSNCFFYVI